MPINPNEVRWDEPEEATIRPEEVTWDPEPDPSLVVTRPIEPVITRPSPPQEQFEEEITTKGLASYIPSLTLRALQGLTHPLFAPFAGTRLDTNRLIADAIDYWEKKTPELGALPDVGLGVGKKGKIRLEHRKTKIKDLIGMTAEMTGAVVGPIRYALGAGELVTTLPQIAARTRPFYRSILKGMIGGSLIGEGDPQQTLEDMALFGVFEPIAYGLGKVTEAPRIIRESTAWRKMNIKERGLILQSLDNTIQKHPKMSEGEILRRWNNPQWKEEALGRRITGEEPGETWGIRPEVAKPKFEPTKPIISEVPKPQRLSPKEVKEVVWEKPKEVGKLTPEEVAAKKAKLAAAFEKRIPPEKVWPKGSPEEKAQGLATQVSKEIGRKIKFDDVLPDLVKGQKQYQFTPEGTKELPGTTFYVPEKELTPEGLKFHVERKIADFKGARIEVEIDKEMPGHDFRYVGIQKGEPNLYQFKARTGPLKDTNISIEKLDTESLKAEVTSRIKVFKEAEPVKLPEVKPKAEVAKEPWEMTLEEYTKMQLPRHDKAKGGMMFPNLGYEASLKTWKGRIPRLHKEVIEEAISEGKITSHPDYPELGKKPKPVTVAKPTRKVQGISYQYKGQEFTAKTYLDYKGYKIVKRHEKAYDILDKNNKIVGQMAGQKGAVARIDKGTELTPLEERYPPKAVTVEKPKAEVVREPILGTKEYLELKRQRRMSAYDQLKAAKEGRADKGTIKMYEGLLKETTGEFIEAEKALKPSPTTLETFPGFQKMYEAVAKGQETKVRARVEAIRKEYLTPVEGNPLDKGAIEFLKSEKYKDYVKEMPGIGELSPKEIFKYDPTAKKLIATIETKGGELKPAIRQSGYHALKEFADSFEGARDISKLSASWTDPTRMIQEIDQGKFRGMAQKHVLWPTRMTTLAKLRWQDLRKGELAAIQEKYNVSSGKKARAVGDVIEHIETKDVGKSAEQLLQNPKIQRFLKPFKAKVKTQILDAAKELRTFSDKLLDAQNIPRKIRKQKEIPKRAFYRTWIMETNLWSKLLGQKIRPEEIMEKPTMPDFIFPNQPFNPRAEARTGLMAKYPKERNIFRLLTDYVDSAGKDIFDTNIVHNNKIHAAVLRSKGLENAAEGINRWTAEVFAGVDPRLTRWAKETVPPRLRKGILAIRRNLTRAVFPLNWTWNLFIQTSSAGITYARYGTKANLAGLKYFLSPTTRRSVKQNAYSYILKSRWGGKAHYQDVQKSISRNKRLEARPIEKVEDFLNYLTSAFEDGLTGHAVAAAYSKGKSLGLKGRELWEYASEGGAKTQSMYNYGDVPGMLRAREVGAIAPFQTFGFEVFNTIREMNFPGVRRLIGKTGLYETLSADSIAGKALMSKRLKMLARWVVAIAITDMVGEAAIGRKPWVVSSFMPFIGWIVGGYAGRGPVPHQYLEDAKKGIRDVLVYGNFKRLRKWVMRYHVIAGVQLERMIEGLEAVSKGQVTDIKGRTLFRLEPEDYWKAITMGPYRTGPGKEYIRKRRGKLTLRDAHQTIQ